VLELGFFGGIDHAIRPAVWPAVRPKVGVKNYFIKTSFSLIKSVFSDKKAIILKNKAK